MKRRELLAGIVAASTYGRLTAQSLDPASGGGPSFSPSGPNAEHYGFTEGFPVHRPPSRARKG
ncbi:MAG TPA: hypothetical protein VLX09_22850 [Stellaceae bacterium]|nr:hypothetical protein [Stellaceae bacterium]